MPPNKRPRAAGPLLLLVAAGLLTGCTGEPGLPAGTYVDALGLPASIERHAGKYVWIDYAAEWCAACVPQTLAIKSAAASAPPDLVFVTIMTSERDGYGHPATAETAAHWAKRFDLDPSHVWAANLTSWTLPRHRLLSPDGSVLLDHTGELGADAIKAKIRRMMPAGISRNPATAKNQSNADPARRQSPNNE